MRLARLWRTRRPLLFTEKVRCKMLRDRLDLLVTIADKAAVRGHVAHAGLGHLLPEAFAVLDDADGLLALDLQDSYVVKPTHGSGATIVVSSATDADAVLPRPEWGWGYAHVRGRRCRSHGAARHRHGMVRAAVRKGSNEEWAYSGIRRTSSSRSASRTRTTSAETPTRASSLRGTHLVARYANCRTWRRGAYLATQGAYLATTADRGRVGGCT